jgi:hypothetical protein
MRRKNNRFRGRLAENESLLGGTMEVSTHHSTPRSLSCYSVIVSHFSCSASTDCNTPTGQSCPIDHPNWAKEGCITTLVTSIGAQIRHQFETAKTSGADSRSLLCRRQHFFCGGRDNFGDRDGQVCQRLLYIYSIHIDRRERLERSPLRLGSGSTCSSPRFSSGPMFSHALLLLSHLPGAPPAQALHGTVGSAHPRPARRSCQPFAGAG